jgi:hypothetical protein
VATEEKEIMDSFEDQLANPGHKQFVNHDFQTWVGFLITTLGQKENGWFLDSETYDSHITKLFSAIINDAKNADRSPQEEMHWYRYEHNGLDGDMLSELKDKFTQLVMQSNEVHVNSETDLFDYIFESRLPESWVKITTGQVEYLTEQIIKMSDTLSEEFYWWLRFPLDNYVNSDDDIQLRQAMMRLVAELETIQSRFMDDDESFIKMNNINRTINGKNGLLKLLASDNGYAGSNQN